MVHDLYCAQALFGGAEPDHFSAQVHYMGGHRVDLATAELRFPSGGIARFAASYLTPPGMPGDGFDRMEVFGHSWSGRIHPNPRPLEWYDNRARWPMELEIRDNPLAATGMLAEELRCFCRVVRGVAAGVASPTVSELLPNLAADSHFWCVRKRFFFFWPPQARTP